MNQSAPAGAWRDRGVAANEHVFTLLLLLVVVVEGIRVFEQWLGCILRCLRLVLW